MEEEVIMRIFELVIRLWFSATIICGVPMAQFPDQPETIKSRIDFVCAADINGDKWNGYGTFYRVIEPKEENSYLPYIIKGEGYAY